MRNIAKEYKFKFPIARFPFSLLLKFDFYSQFFLIDMEIPHKNQGEFSKNSEVCFYNLTILFINVSFWSDDSGNQLFH